MRCFAAVIHPKRLPHIDWKSETLTEKLLGTLCTFSIPTLPCASHPIRVLSHHLGQPRVASFVTPIFCAFMVYCCTVVRNWGSARRFFFDIKIHRLCSSVACKKELLWVSFQIEWVTVCGFVVWANTVWSGKQTALVRSCFRKSKNGYCCETSITTLAAATKW